MSRVHGFRSLSIVVVLALLLTTPWPVEASPSEAPRAEVAANPFHLFLEWLAGFWDDNGCTFDPSGSCRESADSESPSGAESLDNGCTFDPNGLPCRDDR